MERMSKILIAVSDRWVADERVDAIATFAQRMEATLLLIHVAEHTEPTRQGPSAGETAMEQVAARLKAAQMKVETLLLFADDMAAAILKTAQEHQVTLIMLGLGSKGMIARLVEGDVAQNVVRNTRLPVLLLPAEWNGEI